MEKFIIKFEDKYSPGLLKSAGVASGIVGGLILILTGLILTIISYFEQNNFDTEEIILLVSGLAFLTIGAHSLDLIEKDKKSRRTALSKERALKIETCGKQEHFNQ